MSENETGAAEQEAPEAKNKPSHHLYQVTDGDNGKAYFNRIGALFAHKDGEGFNIVFHSLPVNGRAMARTPKERLQDLKEGKTQRGKGAREPER